MVEKVKKYQRSFLVVVIVICMGIMALGAVVYLENIKGKIADDAIQGVMDVTMQQRQAFENFVSGDRERLHSYAAYFSGSDGITEETVNERQPSISPFVSREPLARFPVKLAVTTKSIIEAPFLCSLLQEFQENRCQHRPSGCEAP